MQQVIGLPRQAMVALAVLGIIAAGIFLASGPLAAQVQTLPDAPESIAVTGGATTAEVSWTAPANTGNCAIAEYFLRVYNRQDYSDTVDAFTASTQYTVSGLNADTDYAVEIYSYSAECDDYSIARAQSSFTTTQTALPSDPTPPSGQPLQSPEAPESISVAPGSTDATVSWTAPANTGRCAILDYAILVDNLTDSSVADTEDYITGTSFTASGLTSGQNYVAYI